MTEGSAAEFSVTASDAQTYQWQQSTDSGSSWTDINSATEASYTISNTTTSMSDNQYRCVVKSASGVSVISQAATLTVTATPTSYTISTADQLRNFAEAVNTGNVTANAVLTADITLKPAFLRTLSAGPHTISIVSQNGTAETSFNISFR